MSDGCLMYGDCHPGRAAALVQSGLLARPGTHSDTIQISKWIPDRAPVPNDDIAMGASGMTGKSKNHVL